MRRKIAVNSQREPSESVKTQSLLFKWVLIFYLIILGMLPSASVSWSTTFIRNRTKVNFIEGEYLHEDLCEYFL